MKRKIKFRAWDKEKKEFFKPTYEAYKDNLEDLSITFSGELLRRSKKHPAEHESCFEGKYELMQFTGFLDKNGKPIYEGDILLWIKKKKPIGEKQYWKVFFDERGEWRAERKDVKQRLWEMATSHEVVGDTYTTPELLTN